jgi:hypothetical protein
MTAGISECWHRRAERCHASGGLTSASLCAAACLCVFYRLHCAADVFVYPGSGATCDTQELKLAQEKAQQAQEKAAAAAAGGANGTGPAAAGADVQQVKQEQPAAGDPDTSHMVRAIAFGWSVADLASAAARDCYNLAACLLALGWHSVATRALLCLAAFSPPATAVATAVGVLQPLRTACSLHIH